MRQPRSSLVIWIQLVMWYALVLRQIREDCFPEIETVSHVCVVNPDTTLTFVPLRSLCAGGMRPIYMPGQFFWLLCARLCALYICIPEAPLQCYIFLIFGTLIFGSHHVISIPYRNHIDIVPTWYRNHIDIIPKSYRYQIEIYRYQIFIISIW